MSLDTDTQELKRQQAKADFDLSGSEEYTQRVLNLLLRLANCSELCADEVDPETQDILDEVMDLADELEPARIH